MNQLPRTIKHPLIGDEVSFIKTADETNGEQCLVKVILQPGGGNGLHYHTHYDESFKVLEGKLGLQEGKKTFHLLPGEEYTVNRNRVHRFFNDSKEPVTFLCIVAPARSFEQLLRIAYGLAEDKKVTSKGIPKNIWHLAMMFELGESYLPGVPLWLQKVIFGSLARIGKWKKADRDFHKYIARI